MTEQARFFPGVVSNVVFLTQELAAAPGQLFVGSSRTLNEAALEGWGRSGSTFTQSTDPRGPFVVHAFGVDSEGWFEGWDAKLQTSSLAASPAELVSGKPLGQVDASRVTIPAPVAMQSAPRIPLLLAVVLIAWRFLR
jgi:hypothetical protein